MNINFNANGTATCLWAEDIDLLAIGKVTGVQRASVIEFNLDTQQWDVRLPDGRDVLHSNASREACIEWERNNL
jgi:hypothetical protein